MKVIVINLSLEEYLDKIKPYLRDIIIDLQESDTWKIQLTIAISFFCPKDVDKERVTQSKSNKTKFTLYNDGNEVVDELFETLHPRYQGNLEKPIRAGDFVFSLVLLQMS